MKIISVVFSLFVQEAYSSDCKKAYFKHWKPKVGRMAIEDVQQARDINSFLQLDATVKGYDGDEIYRDFLEDENSQSPEEIIEETEFHEKFLKALESVNLTDTQMAIMKERLLNDPPKEIAQIARERGVSPPAIVSSMKGARKKLKGVLKIFGIERK